MTEVRRLVKDVPGRPDDLLWGSESGPFVLTSSEPGGRIYAQSSGVYTAEQAEEFANWLIAAVKVSKA